MALQIGDTAPDFEAETTEGSISFHDWIGDSWAVLFSHPKDFTPVCTTELGYMAKIKPEFDQRNVKIVGLSVDPIDDHAGWAKDIEETQGHAPNYPIIGDSDFEVSKLYGMLPASVEGDPEERTPADNQTVRNVFVIGPDKKIKLILVYPMTTGRNFDEVLRVIDSMQLTAKHKVATPVNWQQGEDVIIAGSVSNDEAKEIYRRMGVAASPTFASCRSRAEPPGRARTKLMILEQFYLGCLAHASYLVGDEDSGDAAVIDPQRDVDHLPRRRPRARPANRATSSSPTSTPTSSRGTSSCATARAPRIYLGARASAEYAFTPLADGDAVRLGAGPARGRRDAGPLARVDLDPRLRPRPQDERASTRGPDRRHAVHRRRRTARPARLARLERRGARRAALRLAAHQAPAAARRDARLPGPRRRLALRQELSTETVSTIGDAAARRTTRSSR